MVPLSFNHLKNIIHVFFKSGMSDDVVFSFIDMQPVH